MSQTKRNKESNPELERLLKQVGDRMRELRESKGYTNYEYFAYDNNIARSQYGKYEKGTEDLRLSSLYKVLKAMDVSFVEFFEGIG